MQRKLEALPKKVDMVVLAGKIGGWKDDLQDATWTSPGVRSIRILFFSGCQRRERDQSAARRDAGFAADQRRCP